MDFTGEQARLAQLEAFVQAETDPERLKTAYRNLFDEYPLLFGYWLKYLELDPTAWDDALASCPTPELWAAFLDREGTAKDSYERAVAAVGQFFQAHPVWDRYLEFLADPRDKVALLERVSRIPLYQYAKYIKAANDSARQFPELFADKPLADTAEDLANAVNERWVFESRLVRPYFHVVPLTDDELKAWDEYLTFEEEQGDSTRIEALYERCLLATALYPGFWMRYIRWLALVKPEKVDSVFGRMLKYCRHGDPEVQAKMLTTYSVRRALYREVAGDLDGARCIYHQLPRTTEADAALKAFDARRGVTGLSVPEDPGKLYERWTLGESIDTGTLKRDLELRGELGKYFEVDIATHGSRHAKNAVAGWN